MDTMEYKGYRGSLRYSAEDRVLHGRILGIGDVVNFEGADVDELERAFHEAVDDYLALCEKLGRAPDREYSGKIPLRIDSALHRRVAVAADAEGKSVNSWIADTLEVATTAPTRDLLPTSDARERRGRRKRVSRAEPKKRAVAGKAR
jgi:predicted HicB family RNase H-like nuclease